jgi:hypothetical protein
MSRICFTVVLAFCLALVGHGQTSTRSVVLNWTDTANPAGVTYNVYRAPSACTGTPAFARITSGVIPKTFTDANVPYGTYCYVVTAVGGGIESAYSPTAGTAVGPYAPSGLTLSVTVNVNVTVASTPDPRQPQTPEASPKN